MTTTPSPQSAEAQEREAFHVEMRKRGVPVTRVPGGGYKWHSAAHAWSLWQAAFGSLPSAAASGEALRDRIIDAYKEHYDFPTQGESHMRDVIDTVLESRASLPSAAASGEASAVQEAEAGIPLSTIHEWLERRMQAMGPAGITSARDFAEEVVRWTERQHAAPTPAVEGLTAEVLSDLAELHKRSTVGKWQKGRTTHETVSKWVEKEPYHVAEFRHADDASFCDAAHEWMPRMIAAIRLAATPVPMASSAGEPTADAQNEIDALWMYAQLYADEHAASIDPLRTHVAVEGAKRRKMQHEVSLRQGIRELVERAFPSPAASLREQEDAARYRWLRNEGNKHLGITPFCALGYDDDGGHLLIDGAAMDEAIDAQRLGREKEKTRIASTLNEGGIRHG